MGSWKVCLFCVTFWSNNSVVRDIGVILGHKVALVMSDILVWHWNNKIEIADIGRRAEVGSRVLASETPAGLISQSSYHSPKSTLSKASSQSIMLLQNQILSMLRIFCSWQNVTGCFYWLLTPLKVPSTKKIIYGTCVRCVLDDLETRRFTWPWFSIHWTVLGCQVK